jgi:hypothetical protein
MANYSVPNQSEDKSQTLIKALNERILRHFVKLYTQSLTKYEMKSIFSSYIEKQFDSRHDKNILEISNIVVDKISSFMFKHYQKFYYDSKAFGINISI